MSETANERAERLSWSSQFVQNIIQRAEDLFYPSDVRELEPPRPESFRCWWHRLMFNNMVKESSFENIERVTRRSKAPARAGAPETLYLKPYWCRSDQESTGAELLANYTSTRGK